jgi:glycerol-3-phosphate acyltransferase PlsY
VGVPVMFFDIAKGAAAVLLHARWAAVAVRVVVRLFGHTGA